MGRPCPAHRRRPDDVPGMSLRAQFLLRDGGGPSRRLPDGLSGR
ncbi:hypothetical protein SGL43_01281 [Streptomyces globisporus]|uniref:Uncharacterized protein n=1 Tax=Streptomyces globisporus TaxID=1908 RepID=A0ABM9GS85_STRGL|nr:hypothetical protein SGL43_01281 [Streptomyces globisporus]